MAETTKQSNTATKHKLVVAHARSLRIAPRKVRLVTELVKNLSVEQAITQLNFANKKAAPMIVKLLKSALANAEHNFSLKPEDLYIKSITCDMGPVMKRYFPRARGSAFTIRHKLSHVHVVLEERPGKAKKRRARLAPAAKTAVSESKTVLNLAEDGSKGPVAKQKQAPQAKEQKPVKTDEQIKGSRAQIKRIPQAK